MQARKRRKRWYTVSFDIELHGTETPNSVRKRIAKAVGAHPDDIKHIEFLKSYSHD